MKVLSALASCDEQIRDEIILRTKSDGKPSDPLPPSETGDTIPECIMIEEFEANQDEIKRCFTNIRKNMFPVKESRRIQTLCIEKGIDTSVEYALLRNEMPELPEDPLPKGMLWYDYLHPMRDRLTGSDFVKTILEPNNLHASHTYDEWRGVQPTDVIAKIPSVQHITDGFFSETNFNTLLETFGQKVRRVR